jgi:sulfatase maturation enzyme AslB (radical SAM superfamily)
MRITNSGGMIYCRWTDKNIGSLVNIKDVDPVDFFQQHMNDIRSQMTDGKSPDDCKNCYRMEQHNKVSGRQKQLLKVGVRLEQFEKTLASSPWVDTFRSKEFSQLPQDWQIDLGNYCNSACIFCHPGASSRLAAEWKRIGFIDQMPPENWTDSPELINKFIAILESSKHIQYLHFIGGETLITPAFRTILKALIRAGLNQTATIGFTTNLITWDQEVVDLLTQFSGVNLGMSIESFDPINDYVRWPATLPKVHETLDRWLHMAKSHGWLMQFRTTPTVLTIDSLMSVYQYAWDHGIAIESCNFLDKPEIMRPSVMPMVDRQLIIDRMNNWIAERDNNVQTIVNTRDPNVAKQQIINDLQSYVEYLKHEPDESFRLPELMTYLKRIESGRDNSVLTYLPQYEELFRTAGY